MAYAGVRAGPKVGLVLRGITLLPIAMPGIIGPIAVLWGFFSLPGARALFGTIWLVILALMVRVLPVAVQLGTAAINQVSRDLEDAAKISGQSPVRAAVGITGRLLLPSFLAGWFMAGVLVINNLEVPLLLGGTQTETVATRIYGLYVGSVPSQGAALLVMTVVAIAAVGAVGLVLMKVLGRVLTRMSALEPPVEPDEADTDTDAGSGPAAVPGRSSGSQAAVAPGEAGAGRRRVATHS